MVAISAGSLPQNSTILLPQSNLPNFRVGVLVFSLSFRDHGRRSTATTDGRTATPPLLSVDDFTRSILLQYRIPLPVFYEVT
jgi:hypothetical protein